MPRRRPGAPAGAHVIGGLLLFAGLTLMWVGSWVLFYGLPAADAAGRCGAMCELFTLAVAVLGPVAGQVVAGSLVFLAGLGLALVGRYLYDAKKTG